MDVLQAALRLVAMMKTLTIPTVVKLALGGGAAGLLGLGALTATPVLAAATPAPSASPAAPAAHGDARQDRRQVVRVLFEAEAGVLGLKPEELRADLRSGQTVEQLAAAKGMGKDQFADRLATAAKPGLDKLVDEHKITSAQETRVLAAVRAGHVPFWNGARHRTGTAQPSK